MPFAPAKKVGHNIAAVSTLFSIFSLVFGLLLNFMGPVPQNEPHKRKMLCSTLAVFAGFSGIFYTSIWSFYQLGPGDFKNSSQVWTAWLSVIGYFLAFLCWMKSPLDVGLVMNRIVGVDADPVMRNVIKKSGVAQGVVGRSSKGVGADIEEKENLVGRGISRGGSKINEFREDMKVSC